VRKLFFVIVLFSLSLPSFSQIGGQGTYEFLNLTNSARIAAMGGDFLAVRDNDLSLAVVNPSLITPKMNNNIALSFVNYYAGVNYGFAAYSRTLPKLGSLTAGIQFIDYGTFTRADATGQALGTFRAGDYAMHIGWGRQLDSAFSIGSNFKMIYSDMDDEHSFGLAVDVAGTYYFKKKDLTISLLAKNVGRQIKAYRTGNIENLPMTMEFGLTQRLKHLPFRFSLIYTHLEKYDLTYNDPTDPTDKIDPLTNTPIPKDKTSKFFDKLGRHFVIGGEFMPGNNLSLRLGYNYERRKELGTDTKMSTVGFSWGFGIRVKQFQFSYTRSRYHLVGSPNYITIVADLGKVL
jgi:hypothetical protein